MPEEQNPQRAALDCVDIDAEEYETWNDELEQAWIEETERLARLATGDV